MPKDLVFKIPVTQEIVERYAQISGDHNPLHLDITFAERAGFKGTIVHGMLTLALCYETLLSHFADQRRLAHLAVRFREPLYPGDTLCIRSDSAGETLTIGTENGRALFKDFKLRWHRDEIQPPPSPPPPAFVTQFEPRRLEISRQNCQAYENLMRTMVPNYFPNPQGIFPLAQQLVVQLLDHLNRTHPLHAHRVLHLAQDLTIQGQLDFESTVSLHGGVTQESHKMGQNFLHFFQKFSTADGGFVMDAMGFGVVQRLI